MQGIAFSEVLKTDEVLKDIPMVVETDSIFPVRESAIYMYNNKILGSDPNRLSVRTKYEEASTVSCLRTILARMKDEDVGEKERIELLKTHFRLVEKLKPWAERERSLTRERGLIYHDFAWAVKEEDEPQCLLNFKCLETVDPLDVLPVNLRFDDYDRKYISDLLCDMNSKSKKMWKAEETPRKIPDLAPWRVNIICAKCSKNHIDTCHLVYKIIIPLATFLFCSKCYKGMLKKWHSNCIKEGWVKVVELVPRRFSQYEWEMLCE